MFTRILSHVQQTHQALRRSEHLYMVLLAIFIGLLGGIGAVGFRELIRLVNEVAWHHGQYTLDYLRGLPPWWKVLAPSLGGLLVGLIGYYFAREVKGHGVPEVMEAVALRGGRIRPRVVIAKLLASGVCSGSGGSVGREGPIVQIGSALGSTVGQWLGVDPQRLRTLVGCGAAAGIAATFNAPIAGALFAVEIILGDFGVAKFSPIVISSVTGTVVSQHFLGDFPAFVVPPYSLVHAGELLAYAGLGLLAGLAALAFTRTLYATEDLVDRIRIYPPLKTMAGGALIGIIGIWLPQIYGVGYETINDALNGDILWKTMAILVVVKLLAVSITIGSGGSGGIFAPSLFIGAMLGGTVGVLVHSIWPASTGSPGAYALVGMGAVVAAGTHAPITAIVIIFELTSDYKIILPLMISCIIATLLATQLQTASIYTMKLMRRGVDIRGGRAFDLLQSIPVHEQMRTDMATVRPHDGLMQLVSRFMHYPGNVLFVVDDDQRLLGIIAQDHLRPAMTEASSLNVLVIAQDLMIDRDFTTISPDDSLAHVMKLLGSHEGEVPVLRDGRLVGAIWPQDVIARYNAELFNREMARGMVSAMGTSDTMELIPSVANAAMVEILVPASFVGKSIGELNVRRDYGCSILMIKRNSGGEQQPETIIPSSGFVFQFDDIMLVLGQAEDLANLRHGVPS